MHKQSSLRCMIFLLVVSGFELAISYLRVLSEMYPGLTYSVFLLLGCTSTRPRQLVFLSIW